MKNQIDHILVKTLTGQATPEEKAVLDQWLDTDSAHFSEFVKLKSYWESQVKIKSDMTADEAFDCFVKDRITPSSRKKGRYVLLGLVSAAAAIGLLLITLGKPFPKPIENYTFSTQNAKDTILLPDSSTVILNKFSRLDYTSRYNKSERHLKLVGEAYFDVRKNPRSPFIVDLNQSRITVLGTAFNVRAYESDQSIRTVLVRGSIRFSMGKDQVTLKPNQELEFNKLSEEINIKSVDVESSMLWMKNVYRFQSASLQQMMDELGNVYDKQMNIEGWKLANTVISGSFQKGQSLDDILNIISMSVPIKWEINNESVNISYK